MKIFRVIALSALSLFGSASMAQTCKDFGNMGPPDTAFFGNSFSAAGSYTDCYTFTLNSAANSLGGAIELDLSTKLDIDILSVSLFGGGVNMVDTSPLSFSFGALAGGAATYTLAIVSTVTGDPSRWTLPVGYLGKFATLAAPVPEPSTYAMLLLGLLGVGAAVRRSKLR